jgi:voltage-gated potassium channel Kch
VPAAAQGDRERIGDIGRLGGLGEVPDRLDGALHLELSGVAVTDHGLLDAVGRVLLDPQALSLRDEEYYTAGVAHEDGRPWMSIVRIELFDSADVGFVFGDELFQLVLQLGEALGERFSRGQADHAAGDEGRAQQFPIDHAIAGEAQAGINAENSHRRTR